MEIDRAPELIVTISIFCFLSRPHFLSETTWPDKDWPGQKSRCRHVTKLDPLSWLPLFLRKTGNSKQRNQYKSRHISMGLDFKIRKVIHRHLEILTLFLTHLDSKQGISRLNVTWTFQLFGENFHTISIKPWPLIYITQVTYVTTVFANFPLFLVS